MTNNLIQELFNQINRLENQNQRLITEINTIHHERDLVCRYTQFDDWKQFMTWICSKNQTTSEVVSSSDRHILTPEGAIAPINQLVSTLSKNKLIFESLKTSQILSQGHAYTNTDCRQALTNRFGGKFGFTFSKTKPRQSVCGNLSSESTDFEEVECIVLENSRLRKNNTQLERQVSIYRENIQRLVQLVGESHQQSSNM